MVQNSLNLREALGTPLDLTFPLVLSVQFKLTGHSQLSVFSNSVQGKPNSPKAGSSSFDYASEH